MKVLSIERVHNISNEGKRLAGLQTMDDLNLLNLIFGDDVFRSGATFDSRKKKKAEEEAAAAKKKADEEAAKKKAEEEAAKKDQDVVSIAIIAGFNEERKWKIKKIRKNNPFSSLRR